jgi:cytochrome P450
MQTLPYASPSHPLLGVLPEFKKDRIGLLTRLPRQYGDVARVRLGLFVDCFIVSSPELVRAVLLEKQSSFVKSFGLSVFARPLLGSGLLTSERDVHKRQRRMIAPAFSHQRIASYADTFAACAERAALRIQSKKTTDLADEMMTMTLEIVGKTLFGTEVASDADVVGEAVTVAMKSINAQIGAVFPLPPAIPSPTNRRLWRAVRRLDEVVYRLIRSRRAEGGDHGDLLSMLLLAQDEDAGEVMTDEQVRDEAMTIFLAGHETTANALAWSFLLLSKHPDIRGRLEAEVDAVLGGRLPTLADATRLPYALQVLKEAMRLYPPAYMIGRRALEPVTMGKLTVPKNQVVIIDVIGMHGREKYFSDPTRFDPDRFLPEAEKLIDKYAYLPFGGGSRVCVGNHFALLEGQLALAHLIQRFRFDLLPDSASAEPEPLITLRPKHGVQVTVTKRN